MLNRSCGKSIRLIKKYTHTPIKPIRVFFAIFPNQSAQKQLAHQAELLEPICGGRKVKIQHIHLTLLFLGNVSAHRIEALQQSMSNITAKEFEFSLEEICYWEKNKIIYIQAKKFPSELFSLVDSLKDILSRTGFLFDIRAYKPHVTLIRKATHQTNTALIKPIKWHVDKWFLIQSKQNDSDVDYIPLGQWRLQPIKNT